MYDEIYVPLDNSEHASACMDLSIALAAATGSELVGSHVYAARMHDMRFKQMEFTLPDQYREEEELEKQREVHDSLIGIGLQLISNSYLEVMEKRCADAGLPFEKKTFDGQNYRELVKDIRASDYGLVVMGAHGQGAVKGSLIGSVTERVMRRIEVDSLVVKDVRPWRDQIEGADTGGPGRQPIVVALDGSAQSFHGLKVGMYFAGLFNRPLKAVGVFDPFLHYSIFHNIADVLSDEASQVFKFKEQEQLHEEVIDTGLAKIYQSHLDVGRCLAEAEGVELETTLLPGKPFEKVLQFVRDENAWMLICGRIGVHSEPDMDMGSNSENLLRLAPCNILLASGRFVPPVDVIAKESVHWTEAAVQRMAGVPDFVRGVARQAVLRWALERGHSVVTSNVIDQAMGDVLPPGAAAVMGIAAQTAGDRLGEETYVCRNCGHTARRGRPATCTVCGRGSEAFERLDKEAITSRAQLEGVVEAERTFDGTRLFWTAEARRSLRDVPSGFPRRSARARVEKLARVRKLPTVTAELVAEVAGDGKQRVAELPVETAVKNPEGPAPEQEGGGTAAGTAAGAAAERSGKRSDEGEFRWAAAALARLHRVPEGFMRDLTREHVENYARQQNTDEITLEVAEGGIVLSRKSMADSMAGHRSPPAAADGAAGDSGKGRRRGPTGGMTAAELWGRR